jgi:hypothetical protein
VAPVIDSPVLNCNCTPARMRIADIVQRASSAERFSTRAALGYCSSRSIAGNCDS